MAAMQNSFRLSSRTVGFKDRRDQYVLHVNCPCNLKKSLVGEYQSQEEALAVLPAWCVGEHRVRHCPKSQKVVSEQPTPKKTRRAPARSRFVAEVAKLILDAPHDGSLGEILSTGHEAIVARENGRYTSLVVKGDHGNQFEFRCPLRADQAKKIATQIWDLMQTMGL